MSDSVTQMKSITDCIDDGEFAAAKKLLKRHQKWMEETTKKVKLTFLSMSDAMRSQRLSVAGLKQEMMKKEILEMQNNVGKACE